MENKNEIQTVNQMPVQLDNQNQLQQTIERAENYMTLLDRMRKTAINLTNMDDWIDQGGKPYLQKAGCDKISGGFGVKFFDVITEKENVTDDKGTYIAYITTGYASWNNKEIHETGTATSRDDFFALRKDKETGEKILLPLSEIDPMDVRKKSHTNFQNRAIKGLLGLSFTWEEIEQQSGGRLGRNVCGSVNYKSGSKGGSNSKQVDTEVRAKLWERLVAAMDGEENHARGKLKEFTTYEWQGKQIPGKLNINDVSDKQLKFVEQEIAKLEKPHA
jgi:hypothetical protein